jgi:nicotinate dehydrogenase subunit B
MSAAPPTTTTLPATPTTSPSLDDNPRCSDWIDLGREGRVTVKTGKVEIGQGIVTALAQIAADELDVEPERVAVLSGHTALGPLEAGTSSSLSMEQSGAAVRLAASATRALLVAEAAKLLQATPTALSVSDGRILRDGAPTDLTYWTLATSVDLGRRVAEHAQPKRPGERRLSGRSLARTDLPAKAAGAGFIHDLVLPGMLHGRVLDPPSADRRLVAFDGDALQAAFSGITLVVDGSFIGVVAEREEVAVQAVAAARRLARWTPETPVPATLSEAIAADAAGPEVVSSTGDFAAAAGRSVALTIEKPYIAHASLAPSCAIARWHEGGLEVQSHSQGVHDLRDAFAIAFGLEPARVVVEHVAGAGTYGHSGQDDAAYEAALLARAVPGRPVRLLWPRAADFALAPMGPGMRVEVEAKLAETGRITAFRILSTGQPHVFRPGRGGTLNLVAAERLATPFPKGRPSDVPPARGGGADRNATPLYAIANVTVAKRLLRDLPYRTSALRGLGGYANVLAIESLMDEAALLAGADPVAFRLAHLDDPRARAVVETAATLAAWPGEPREPGEGFGIGFCRYKNRSAYCAVVVRVVCDERVRLTHAWAAVDAGEAVNPDGISNQIEGGIVQAASWTLKERVQLSGETVLSRSWGEYPILRFSEVPEIAVSVIARPEAAPLGCGEAAAGPTVGAIANAVRRALGVRVTRLPIDRDAILAAGG